MELRQDFLLEIPVLGKKSAHPDDFLHKTIRSTGLVYGWPTYSAHAYSHAAPKREIAKMVLTEGLLSGVLLFEGRVAVDPSARVASYVEWIGNYYHVMYPEWSVSSKDWFGRRLTVYEVLERALEKRIAKFESDASMYARVFQGTLLVWDIVSFSQWIHNKEKIVADYLRLQYHEFKFSLAKVVTALCSRFYGKDKIFEKFIRDLDMPLEKRKELSRLAAERSLEQLHVLSESVLMKKILLEVAIILLLKDHHLDDDRLNFISEVCSCFSFTQEEKENALVAVAGFVVDRGGEIFPEHKNLPGVARQFQEYVTHIAANNKSRLIQEARRDVGLLAIVRKARTTELDDQEREFMRRKLFQMLSVLTPLQMFTLPEQFLTLPVLLRIFPQDLFSQQL